jgi:hypothetical protein
MPMSEGRKLTPEEAEEFGRAMQEAHINGLVDGLRRMPEMEAHIKRLGLDERDPDMAEALNRFHA